MVYQFRDGGERFLYSRMPSSLWAVVYTLCVIITLSPSEGSQSHQTSSHCKPRYYSHRVVQTDDVGKKCWDDVKMLYCRGFCLTYEVSDWQFPYTESHHPVCVHAGRKRSLAKLRFCDPGVLPGTEEFHYVEAKSCKCQTCSSEDTSCEWLRPYTELLGDLMINEDLDNETED